MTITRRFTALAGFVLLALAAAGCESDPTTPDNNNPQELITTVRLTLTDPSNPSTIASVQWRDADGPGGAAPTVDTLRLRAGQSYEGRIVLLDETKTPADTISNEVEEESSVHQFFYTPSASLATALAVTITDRDANNYPVGLETTVTTSASTTPLTGTLRVVLSHYDAQPKNGTTPSVESDVDIELPVVITP